MSDLLNGLYYKAKMLRCGVPPGLKGFRGGHSVERRIDFHRWELGGVKRQHLLIGQIAGIELPLPLLVAEAGGSHQYSCHVTHYAASWSRETNAGQVGRIKSF